MFKNLYDIKNYNTGEKKRIFFVVEEDPDNNIDTKGMMWDKIIARGKKTKRRQTKRRQNKRKRRQSRIQRQSKRRRIY